jgi:hypothetical protein
VSSRQPNMVSCRIVEALRIVFCYSMADNYDDVSTLQDVGRLLMFFFGDMLGLQVSPSPVMLGTVPWALSVIY